MSVITDQQFDFFVKFLDEGSGYRLLPDKKYLLESRLATVLSVDKLETTQDIIDSIHRAPSGPVAEHVIEVMTINETFFFRDQSPFETFENDILPTLAKIGEKRPVHIWSAACSTGQEPYSIAMIIEENKHKYPHLQYRIVASDINNRILAKARNGLFSDLEVNRGLPSKYKDKYFAKDGSNWVIKDNLKDHIQFKCINLKGTYPSLGPFDVVLLRNVLIYFDEALKEAVLKKVMQTMNPDGYLILGAAEGIYDPKHYFVRCKETKNTYRLRPQ